MRPKSLPHVGMFSKWYEMGQNFPGMFMSSDHASG